MTASRVTMGMIGAAAAVLALVCAPSIASVQQQVRRGSSSVSLSAPGSLGSFTPAAADPRRGSALARGGLSSSGFRFTPSSAPGSRRAVTVAIRARASTKAEAERSASMTGANVAPSAYNLGVAVGWKRFALTGDIAKVETGPLPGGHEAVDVGLSYAGKSWSTRVQLGADRTTGDAPRLLGEPASYSVDFGGSYSLTRNLEVTGGLRYKRERDRLEQLNDDRRDSQAVYIGTAFRF